MGLLVLVLVLVLVLPMLVLVLALALALALVGGAQRAPARAVRHSASRSRDSILSQRRAVSGDGGDNDEAPAPTPPAPTAPPHARKCSALGRVCGAGRMNRPRIDELTQVAIACCVLFDL